MLKFFTGKQVRYADALDQSNRLFAFWSKDLASLVDNFCNARSDVEKKAFNIERLREVFARIDPTKSMPLPMSLPDRFDLSVRLTQARKYNKACLDALKELRAYLEPWSRILASHPEMATATSLLVLEINSAIAQNK
jgi:hypothetical protein